MISCINKSGLHLIYKQCQASRSFANKLNDFLGGIRTRDQQLQLIKVYTSPWQRSLSIMTSFQPRAGSLAIF